MMSDSHTLTVRTSATRRRYRWRLRPLPRTPAQVSAAAGYGPPPGDLAGIVDGMEQRIIAARVSAGVAGNATERAHVRRVYGEDQAPD